MLTGLSNCSLFSTTIYHTLLAFALSIFSSTCYNNIFVMSLFMSERFSTDKSKKNFCPGHFKTCFRINAVPKLNLKKREKISITIFQRENTVVRKSAIGGDFVRK